MASTSCNQGLSRICSQQAMSPNKPSALSRAFSSAGVRSVVMATVFLKCVVGGECVGDDDEVAMISSDHGDGHGRREAALGPALIEHLAHGADVDRVALENFDERVFESFGAGALEQPEQA